MTSLRPSLSDSPQKPAQVTQKASNPAESRREGRFANPNPQRDFDGQPAALIDRVVNLLDPGGNVLLGNTIEQATAAVASGEATKVREIAGQFAICVQVGKTIRMARSIGRPMRYFLAKRAEGPALIVAERIDEIREQLVREGLGDQFRADYTRMVPAHHLLELQLVGCPDPNPKLTRYFAPPRNRLAADISDIGRQYVGKLAEVCDRWLDSIASDAPIGVLFSGGVDSGAVVVVLDFLLRRRGQSSSRMKAFTLSVGEGASDAVQAADFLRRLNLEMLLEVIQVDASDINWRQAVSVIEDYKPLDVQAAAMGYATLKEVRSRYPDWRYIVDGDGGDENLKDYPIEDNPELTIRSVLGNRMLYQEGWGVDAVKHSVTYSGGQSRGHIRSSAPATSLGFSGFSPFAVADVIQIAEAIPFVDLTDWDHERLYDLKGQVVSAGIREICGVEMPVFPKNRFQHGAAGDKFDAIFPANAYEYRNHWLTIQ